MGNATPPCAFGGPIPASAGIGLRFPMLAEIETCRPAVAGFEIHSENLFGLSAAVESRVDSLRADYWLSLHGVGLSLGSADHLCWRHLEKLAAAVARYEPVLVSDHLSWNRVDGVSLPDLLPIPFTRESLDAVSRNVEAVQMRLQREIAVENISAYLRCDRDEMSEQEFVSELVRRTGCKLLVDLNNLHVNALNLGDDPMRFLDGIPVEAIVEYHLAGPSHANGAWIDTHAAPVPEAVWALYEAALSRSSAMTIVEWDQDLPPLSTLVAEAERAQSLLTAQWLVR